MAKLRAAAKAVNFGSIYGEDVSFIHPPGSSPRDKRLGTAGRVGLARAKPLSGPMRSWRSGWLRGVMKNQDQGPARFSSCRREGIGGPPGTINAVRERADLLPIRRLEAGFARQGVQASGPG